MDAPTFRVGAEMWESLAPAAIWVGADDTDVQRLGHVIPKPAIVDGTGDVAACGDLLGGNHHSTAAYFAGIPGLRYPTRVRLRTDRHRLPDGVVNYVRRFLLEHVPGLRNMQVDGARDPAGQLAGMHGRCQRISTSADNDRLRADRAQGPVHVVVT